MLWKASHFLLVLESIFCKMNLIKIILNRLIDHLFFILSREIANFFISTFTFIVIVAILTSYIPI